MLAQTQKLTTVLLLVVLVLGAGQALSQAAEDQPPGRLGSPVSLKRGEILPAYTGCGGVYGVPSSNENYEQEVVDRVNAVRAENALPPLKQVESLNEAARYHATDMAQDDYFDHDTYDRSGGNLVRTCAWWERVESYYSSWWYLAENAAAGYGTPESVTQSFTPILGNLPHDLSYTYSIPEGELLPNAHQVTPRNVGSDDALTWTVTADGGWFAVDPLNGTTPAPLWITPTSFSTSSPVTYTGAVTVTVTDPADVEGSPHRIDLTLRVKETSLNYAYLPLALRSYTPLPQAQHPDDPYYVGGLQWPLNEVNAPRAWGLSTGENVLIAVLDSGADLDHPDLIGKLRTDIDKDFVTGDHGDDVADDDHGHGTHVAGIAAATTDNGIGVAGVGWEATILPLKVLDETGNGDGVTLAAAIRYAADRGADVINVSLGGPTYCPDSVRSAVDYAYNKGVLLVAAAGNHGGSNGPNAEMFPANCERVLGVAATEQDDDVASYSNYGGHVSVAAPGSYVYNTLMGGSYGYMSGTSMATPHVAGLAALVRARYPSYTPDEIASALLDNAVDLRAAGWDQYSGCGRIDAFESLWKGAQGPSPLCLEGVGPWAVGVGEAPTEAPFVPGEIIVAFRPNAQTEALSLRHGTGAEFLPALEAWRLHVSPGEEQAVLRRLRADPAVAYAELNYLVSAQ